VTWNNLHASVKAIGWVLGGPIAVLEAVLNVVTPSGTVMMLASWEGNPYYMAQRPPEQHRYHLTTGRFTS
jgi:aminoglycoside 3-N-acetyltransferase